MNAPSAKPEPQPSPLKEPAREAEAGEQFRDNTAATSAAAANAQKIDLARQAHLELIAMNRGCCA